MSRYSRNKKALRQIEGRHSVIETLLSNKKVSYIDISESNEVGPQIEKIVSIANEKKIKVNFISKLGDDDYGKLAINKLKNDNIDTSNIIISNEHKT